MQRMLDIYSTSYIPEPLSPATSQSSTTYATVQLPMPLSNNILFTRSPALLSQIISASPIHALQSNSHNGEHCKNKYNWARIGCYNGVD